MMSIRRLDELIFALLSEVRMTKMMFVRQVGDIHSSD